MTLKRILPVVSVILVILLGRFLVIGDIQMNHDEIRSISRTFGTPSQIINWQPIDWPPLFYLTLAVYRLAAGFHPLVMRYFSLLWFAISIASVYRLSLHTNNKYQPALLSAAAYATLGMIAFQSTHLRGYIMSMAMYPLAFYLTVRVFENDTTQWRDSILLGIVLAALFYTTYTLVPAVILLGIYTLLAYPLSRILRWWRPAVMAIPLAIPQFWKLANHIIPTLLERESSSSSTTYFDLNPYPNYQWELIESYAGAALPLWGIILLIVIVLIALRERPSYRVSISLALTSIAGVLIAGAIMPYFGLAAPHYSWWAVFPLVVLAGRGLGYLPRPVWQLALVGLLVFPFLRLPEDQRELRYGNQFVTPFEMVFEWLDDHLAPGDVIFVDPYCTQVYEKCGTAEEWEYFQRVYFPDNRLNIVYDIEQTRNVRRVWYLHVNGFHDTDLQAQILEGRIASLFFGPPDFLWQLYEVLPDPEGR